VQVGFNYRINYKIKINGIIKSIVKINHFFSLEWVSSTTYKPNYEFTNFGVDSTQHDSQRCTFALFSNNLPQDFGHEGKWYKEKCEKTKGYETF
jgi:hypothetical protein